MKSLPSAALMFALLLPGAALAQTPAPATTPPPLPPGPLLARTPEFSSWQVTRTETGSPADPSTDKSAPKNTPPPKKLVTVVTKTNKIIRVESVDQDGQQVSKWCYEGNVYVQQPGWPVPVRFGGPDRMGYYVSYARSDFPECTSVSAKNYTGIKEVLGHRCLTFGGKVENLDEATRLDLERLGKTEEIASYTTDGAAYIDLDSRLPVAVRKSYYIYVYQILPPPTEMQVLPQAITDQIKAERQRESDLTRHPAQS